MIKTKIISNHPNHFFINSDNSIFIADYTELTKTLPIKRSIEIYTPNPCIDNDYFSILNPNKVNLESIVFNNNSFVYSNGASKSQCETVTFPNPSNINSWILFLELKYGINPLNNRKNLKKAIKQLFKTRYHYIQSKVFNKNENICYLIASLPKQSEPFANFALTPSYLLNLKTKHNIILRAKNSVQIENDTLILV